MRPPLLLLVPLLAAGCLAPEDSWFFGGAFAPGYTRDDIAAVCEAGAGTRTCEIATSEPPQFGFGFTSEADCREARERVLAVPHVAHASECRRVG